MSDSIIETTELSKQYRVGRQQINALAGVNLRVAPGEFVAIVGPSGAGKSTCMHLLGALQQPSSGSYRFDGDEITSMNVDALAKIRNQKIGFVFQTFHLQPRASALRNVELPLVYARTPRRKRRDMAARALTAVGLQQRMDHRPAQLSGGEMQRVAIARALINEPKLLLADEPTGALDSATGAEIIALLAELNQGGMTVVVITHDADIARQTRRVLRFHDGRMIADGTPP